MAGAQLPQDLIAAIFLWLPVKSLLRFKCLSAYFCALIDTHSTRSCQTHRFRKLIFQDNFYDKFRVSDFNLDLKGEILPLGKPVSTTLKQVYGHCRGLILLNRSTPLCRFKLALWNPSTRRCRDLSDCPSLVSNNTIIGSGLGQNESRAEFKVFCLVLIEQEDEQEVQVWVSELNSKSWRRIQDFPCRGAIQFPPGSGHYVDGRIHWLCKLAGDPNLSAIVSVDVSKEDFLVEPLPDSFAGNPKELHVLDGSLCISHVSIFWISRADLYVRKKDGDDQFYWIWICSTEEPLVSVLGCLKKGNKVLLDLGQFGLLLYDLKTKCFEKVEMRKDANWKRPILCPESLESVDGAA